MHDYMQALQQRFFQKPQCEEIRQTVDTTSKELFTRMGDEDKRKLLLIVDSMDAIRELGLAEGKEAKAVIKATSVMIGV